MLQHHGMREHLLSAGRLLPRKICGRRADGASNRSGTSRCRQVHQEQKVLLISTSESFSSEPDGYLNERLCGALTEMSPGGVCSLLLNAKDAQILFFAQLMVMWRFLLGMSHHISGIEAALERSGRSLRRSI